MSGLEVRETHRQISITQDAEVTHVSCDCGWNVGLTAPLVPSLRGEQARHRAEIASARMLWREHQCGAA